MNSRDIGSMLAMIGGALVLALAALAAIGFANSVGRAADVEGDAPPTWYIKYIGVDVDTADHCSSLLISGSGFLTDAVTHVRVSEVSPVIAQPSPQSNFYCWAIAFREESGDPAPVGVLHLTQDGRLRDNAFSLFSDANYTRKIPTMQIAGLDYRVWLRHDPINASDSPFGDRLLAWMHERTLP